MAKSLQNGEYHATVSGGKEPEGGESDRLKKRIQKHYNMSAEQFLKVWGEHIHHGYFNTPNDSNDQAQINQVLKLVESSRITAGSRVLDVGCGIGGTARYLAKEKGCKVTAITNSYRQAQLGRELTAAEASPTSTAQTPASSPSSPSSSPPKTTQQNDAFIQLSNNAGEGAAAGAVRILDLDIANMQSHFSTTVRETFDCVWLSEVIFHLHDRKQVFDAAYSLLDSGGCLVIADIFRAHHDAAAAGKRVQKELASIRRNHLCPQLGSIDEYRKMAGDAGLKERHEAVDVTGNVARTWDTELPLRSVLYLMTQGRDAIGYMRGMRSMKRAYAHGTAVYAILCFEKP
ncbi:unnamed protein product [Periconia digitata]|uniref:Methyltransferase type 11 domain-containing protein n=1 Tax=Periconia digitata TaxID=1303443 RepID=A0A9W4U6T9_9PLEO|nr:unnamed protein product [Periconia digitata]